MNLGLRLKGRAADLGAIALILLLPSLLFWKAILGDYTNLPANSYWDAVSHLYPLKLLAAEAFRAGEFPLWNPFTYAGTPLLADIQSAPFYPLDAFFYLSPSTRFYSLTLLLYLSLGGIFMYLFMKCIKVSIAGAITTAMVFMLAGYFVFNLEWRKFYGTFLWFPLVLLALERVLGQGRRWYVLLGGIAVGFALLAGDLRVATYMILGILFYAALRISNAHSQRRGFAFLLEQVGLVMAMVFLGLAIAAVQLLPAFELFPISSRQYRVPYVGWSYFSPFSFPINSLFPYLFGNEAKGTFSPDLPFIDVRQFPTHPRYYAGLFPPLLVLVALWQGRDYYTRAFLYMALSCLALVVIVASPLERVVRSLLPLFGAFRHEDVLHLFFASEAVLAGLGVDLLVRNYDKVHGLARRGAKVMGALCVASLAFLAGASLLVRLRPQWLESLLLEAARIRRPSQWSALEVDYFQDRAQNLVHWLSQVVLPPNPTVLVPILVVAAGSLVVLTLGQTHRARYVSWAIIGILSLDLLYADSSMLAFRRSTEIYPVGTDIKALQEEATQGPFRVHTVFPSIEELIGRSQQVGSQAPALTRLVLSRSGVVPPSAIAYGHSTLIPYYIQSTDGAESYFPARYVEYAAASDGVAPGALADTAPFYNYDSPLLNLLNVKYVLSKKELDSPKLRLAHRGEVLVYENLDVLPRAFWVPQARSFPDSQSLLRHLTSPGFDPKKEILVEESVPTLADLIDGGDLGSPSVHVTEYRLNAVSIRSKANKPGFVFLGDSYYPGWKAMIDGEETRLYRANYLFRAVYVPAGEHELRFVFRPLSFQLGLSITLTSLALIAGLFAYKISQQFKSRGSDPTPR